MADDNLEVRVSRGPGIAGYAMLFRGQRVSMENDRGEIGLPSGGADYLWWGMVGDPGSSMKVEVLRDGEVIATRLQSQIPNSRAAGFDRLRVTN